MSLSDFFDEAAHRQFLLGHNRLGGFFLGLANLAEHKTWNGR